MITDKTSTTLANMLVEYYDKDDYDSFFNELKVDTLNKAKRIKEARAIKRRFENNLLKMRERRDNG